MLVKQTELNDLINDLRAKNKTIVTTNGCFDILHAGHVRYLEQAKSFGDILIVALNSDNSVRRLKGSSRPVNNEQDRAEVLSALKSVDYVTIFDENSPLNLLLQIKPDIHTKGGDYTIETLPEARELMKTGTKIKFIPFVEGKSTTSIIEKMRN